MYGVVRIGRKRLGTDPGRLSAIAYPSFAANG